MYINHISTHHPYITNHQSHAQGSFKSNSSVESKWLEPSKPPTTNNWSELRGVALQPLRQAFMPGPGLKVNLDLRSGPTEKPSTGWSLHHYHLLLSWVYGWCQHVVTLSMYNHMSVEKTPLLTGYTGNIPSRELSHHFRDHSFSSRGTHGWTNPFATLSRKKGWSISKTKVDLSMLFIWGREELVKAAGSDHFCFLLLTCSHLHMLAWKWFV